MKINEQRLRFGVTGRSSRRALTLVFSSISLGSMLLSGCGGRIGTENESSTDPGSERMDGMTFATEQDALAWVDRRAPELGLDIHTRNVDADGRIISLSGVSIGSPSEVEEKHAKLLREMGGTERVVRIAGNAIALAPSKESDVGTLSDALCSGSLCTTHESWKSDYFIYRSLGSTTNVTSGGYEFQRRTVSGQGYYECVDYPGPLPVTCRGYCTYSQDCPSGMTQESAVGYPTCQKTCSGNVPNVTLSITSQAYENQGIVLVPTFAGSNTTHDFSLEVKFWEVVTPGLDTAISRAVGLCGNHSTSGPGGAVVAGKSHWGTVPSTCN
jgi:hypothetical protein